jgi:hypothetical protein
MRGKARRRGGRGDHEHQGEPMEAFLRARVFLDTYYGLGQWSGVVLEKPDAFVAVVIQTIRSEMERSLCQRR